jgi:hypothetical protein
MENRPKSLDELVLRLWWDGHEVDEPALRRVLTTPLERASQEAREFFSSFSDAHEAAEAATAELLDGRASSQWLGIALRRLDRNVIDLSSVLHSLLVLALGGTPAWEFDEFGPGDAQLGELIDRAIGVERAKRDAMPGGNVWLPDPPDPRETLLEMQAAGAFDLLDLAPIVHQASLRRLVDARELAKLLSDSLAVIARGLEAMYTRDHAGVATLRMLGERRFTRFERVMLLRVCLVLGSLVEPERIEEVSTAARTAAPLSELYLCLRSALREHDPSLSATSTAELEALPDDVRSAVGDVVRKQLADHPEWASALDAADSER